MLSDAKDKSSATTRGEKLCANLRLHSFECYVRRLFREALFHFELMARSAYSYKGNLMVSIASAWVGAASYFYNASFRDVVLASYRVNYTTYAVAGAIAASLTTLTPSSISFRDMTFTSYWGRIAGHILFDLSLGMLKALPIFILGAGFLKPSLPLILASFILLPAIMFSASSILQASTSLFLYENPIFWAYFGLWNLFGSIWFPIEALPQPLRILALILPHYHMISLVRDPLIGRTPIYSYLYASFFLPVAIYTSRYMLKRSMEKGTLLVKPQ